MKKTRKLVAFLLLCSFVFSMLTSCITGNGDVTTSPTESESEPVETEAPVTVTAPAEGDKVFNIVYALATIPPVLAALESISNGYETYAIIERGKTYSGIDKIEYFHNAGFDVSSNKSTGFSETEFIAMIDKVKELKAENGNSFFYFYAQDGTSLSCAAIAANAGLSAEDFHVIMCEDGTGAYRALYNDYVDGYEVEQTYDEVYESYVAKVESVLDDFNDIMQRTDNSILADELKYNIGNAYALAALPNFTYYLQDRAIVENHIIASGSKKMLSAFGVEGNDMTVEYKLNLKYQKISEAISKLSEKQRSDYLTLMYGSYYEATYAELTRTERAGETAPAKKLVYIGSRHREYPDFASDKQYGIGGLVSSQKVPASYAELDDKYKTPFLFATEEDYNVFLSAMNDSTNFESDVSDEVKELAKNACFNLYIDYIFTLKFTYIKYGAEYDIIMKGHPREAVGSSEEWGNRYAVSYGDKQSYVYDKLLDSALMAFHESDSIGKLIGMVPYGTAAENLAYLGVEIAIAGLPSSTYNGFDTDVDVMFIMAASNQTMADTDSQVKERFEAGNLTYTDKDGNAVNAVYYNTGNVFKALAKYYESVGDTQNSLNYTAAFNSWLSKNHSGASDIDDWGFEIVNEK